MRTFAGGVTVGPIGVGRGRNVAVTRAVNPTAGVQQPKRGLLIDLVAHAEVETEGVEQHENVSIQNILPDAEQKAENGKRLRRLQLAGGPEVGLADRFIRLGTDVSEERCREGVDRGTCRKGYLIVQRCILDVHLVLDVGLRVERRYDSRCVVIGVHLIFRFSLFSFQGVGAVTSEPPQAELHRTTEGVVDCTHTGTSSRGHGRRGKHHLITRHYRVLGNGEASGDDIANAAQSV